MVLLVGCSQKETENQKLDGPRRQRGVDGIFMMVYDNSPCFYHSSWDNYAATQQAYSRGIFVQNNWFKSNGISFSLAVLLSTSEDTVYLECSFLPAVILSKLFALRLRE